MEDNEVLEVVEAEFVQLGMLKATGPADVIRQATGIATQLTAIIDSRKLYAVVRGKKHVMVEGWTTLGAMLGVVPREVSCTRQEDGGFVAVVELVRANDGAIIGRGSALCGMDETDSKGNLTWAVRPEYSRRSMAVTRATGKAYRLGFSWIMTLAGYSPTPAEEMPREETKKKAPRKAAAKPKKAAPKKPATNGNGRSHLWPAPIVQAAMKELNLSSYQAVGRLNLSTLDPNDAEDMILSWLKVYGEARATAEKTRSAVIANAWLAGEMEDAKE